MAEEEEEKEEKVREILRTKKKVMKVAEPKLTPIPSLPNLSHRPTNRLQVMRKPKERGTMPMTLTWTGRVTWTRTLEKTTRRMAGTRTLENTRGGNEDEESSGGELPNENGSEVFFYCDQFQTVWKMTSKNFWQDTTHPPTPQIPPLTKTKATSLSRTSTCQSALTSRCTRGPPSP